MTAASTVGSIAGNVTLQAGEAYKQVGSDVIAPAGDITILAKKVDITEARETSRQETEDKFKQSALTFSVSSPLLSAMETGQQMADAASNTSDGRMQALAGAAAAFKGYNTYKGMTDASGNFNKDAATDVSINISYGTSESESKSSSQSNSAAGSTVAAGKNLTIVATGAGQASNLTAQGANLTAGNNVTLLADNKVNLLASQSSASQESSNSSSSSSVGVSYGLISQSFSFSASASQSQGNSSGSDTRYTNTQVNAGNTASIISGGDTNLIGAVVAANTVKANVGGNLNIASLQDTSTYTSKQSSSGASISFGKDSASGGSVTGGGISASKSNIDSSYASVVQQSGVKAGDGGFQVNVAGNTDLKGAVIASTQAAVDGNKNSFSTGGTLSISDIQNSAEYKGSGYSVSVSAGSGQDAKGNTIYTPGGGFGIGSTQDSVSSTSSSGISGIAGNAAVRTGDAETGIQKIFDSERVRKEIDAQVAITAEFGQQASSAWGKYANQKMVDATDEEERACWSANGPCRIAGHSIIGALGGGVEGALGATGSTALAPYLSKAIDDLGITGPARDALIAGLSSTIGGVLGGTAGAAGAFNEVTNNYLTSKQWEEFANEIANCKAKRGGCTSSQTQEIRAKYQKISDKQNIALANCDVTKNCAELGKDVATGTETMVQLISSNSLPIGGADRTDLGQFLGQRLAGDPAYRAQVSGALQVAAFCNAKPDQCTATAIKAAALVLAPVIGVAYGAVAIELLVSAGRLTIAEAALLVNLGGPAGYCNLKPDTCLLIADVAAGLASGSVAPSVLPPGSIKAVATMGEALGGKAASSTVSGYISGAKVCESACAISGLTKQEQLMANLIRDSSDNQGVLTEKLLESVATRTGMTVLSGGKYGSNNGFDLVLQGKDGTVTIIMDGKQLAESGAVKLSTAGAGGTNQMSSDWVREVIERIRAKNPNSPAIAAIEVARDGGTLMTAIGGVNRSTGQLLVFPVLVSNKSPSNVSLIPK